MRMTQSTRDNLKIEIVNFGMPNLQITVYLVITWIYVSFIFNKIETCTDERIGHFKTLISSLGVIISYNSSTNFGVRWKRDSRMGPSTEQLIS